MNFFARFIHFSALVLVIASCGGGLSQEQVKRSNSQYELAVGLNQEGNIPGAFQALSKAIEVNPHNANAHLFLGTLHLLIRNDDPAVNDKKSEQYLREAIDIQAGEYASEENLAAEAHNLLGVLYTHQNRLEDAVRELELSVSDVFNRRVYLAWGNLGWAYAKMEKLDKAVDALKRSVKLQPRFCVGWYRLGEVYSRMKRLETAEEVLTKAIEADKRCLVFQEAWLLRGEVRAKMGERDEAISDLERCVELNPDSEAGKSCGRLIDSAH